MDRENALVVFRGKQIRRTWQDDEWYFSVVDVVEVLTDSIKPRDYWYRLKKRELESSGIELSTFCRHLKLLAPDGKMRLTDCADTENVFRIIQSIPSPKAEPFKRWLARVGYERIQEIENPELAQERAKEYYELKGYPKDWIEKRLRGIAIRQELTDEWNQRGVEERKDYAILTNEISKATFDVSIQEHKGIKGLDARFKNQNLRDHMTDLELIFTMLGEASTTEIARSKDARGLGENVGAARKGGKIAGDARRKLEYESGKKVVSSENYLEITGKVRKLENKKKHKK
ncbi:MAG: phage antirepressor protein [Candidatus Altiarchaeales archaeon WOR_SM1_86-2]|nr:MAG: phage antirepressor protein [Candidatus Altiarchaeales archaeon WOR_SM1_86-2]ODS40420.1 MAG: phage antirepressor protein [Candidatus Altiarchaeales archaeon WOR_SM1_79]